MARRSLVCRASIGDWWRRQVEAVSARPFLPVHDTVAAIAFVAQARGDDLRQSAPFQRLVAWATPRSSGAESLSAMLRAVAVPEEGHYFPAAIQEGLLTFLLGQHGASILERDIAALRQPNALPRAVSPPPAFARPAPSTPAPQARGEAPSPQVVPAAPAPRPVRPHVCLTGAPDTKQSLQCNSPAHPHKKRMFSRSWRCHSACLLRPASEQELLDESDESDELVAGRPFLSSRVGGWVFQTQQLKALSLELRMLEGLPPPMQCADCYLHNKLFHPTISAMQFPRPPAQEADVFPKLAMSLGLFIEARIGTRTAGRIR